MLPEARHRASSGIKSSARPKRMQAGNMSTGNTMPLKVPKAARGLATDVLRDRRLGTIRFSTVTMPVRRSSAAASGSAVPQISRTTGIRGPLGGCSLSRRITRQVRVRTAPRLLPSTTQRHALPESEPAQKVRAAMVIAMEVSCSATSTAARVPIRLAAVK